MEKTLVIIKPCALQRGLAGEIISRFERKGLKLTALKMYRFTKEKCAEHYSHLVKKPFYSIIESSMTAAPVILCCWEGMDPAAEMNLSSVYAYSSPYCGFAQNDIDGDGSEEYSPGHCHLTIYKPLPGQGEPKVTSLEKVK